MLSIRWSVPIYLFIGVQAVAAASGVLAELGVADYSFSVDTPVAPKRLGLSRWWGSAAHKKAAAAPAPAPVPAPAAAAPAPAASQNSQVSDVTYDLFDDTEPVLPAAPPTNVQIMGSGALDALTGPDVIVELDFSVPPRPKTPLRASKSRMADSPRHASGKVKSDPAPAASAKAWSGLVSAKAEVPRWKLAAQESVRREKETRQKDREIFLKRTSAVGKGGAATEKGTTRTADGEPRKTRSDRVATKRETLFAGPPPAAPKVAAPKVAAAPKVLSAAARVAAARKAAQSATRAVAKAPTSVKTVLPLNPGYKTHQCADTTDSELHADAGWLCKDLVVVGGGEW